MSWNAAGTTLVMALQVLGLLAVVVLLLTLTGFGVVELLAPDMSGLQYLLSPVVGLGILHLLCQWFTPHLPAAVVVIGAVVGFGVLSLATGVPRHRRLASALRSCRRDLVVAGLPAIILCLLLLSHAFRIGVFTLANPPNDGIFFNAPATEYMRTHAYAPESTPDTPFATALRVFEGRFYPGTLGTVEGGVSAITQQPAHVLLEPLDAIWIAITVVAVHVLACGALRLGRRIGGLAVALLVTNQFVFWAFNQNHVPAIRASPLLVAGAAFLIVALRRGHRGSAALAALLGTALIAVYLPTFLVLGAAGGLFTLVIAVRALLRRDRGPWLGALATLAATAGVLGLPSIYWLTAGRGAESWRIASQTPIDAGYYSITWPVPDLVGTAPVADLYRFQPLLFWTPAWQGVAGGVAACALLLAGWGMIELARRRRLAECALFAGAYLYLLYVRLVSASVYGWVKTTSYILPLTAILLAIGLARLAGQPLPDPVEGDGGAGDDGASSPALQDPGRRARRRRVRTARTALAAAVLAGVVGMQAAASLETEAMYARTAPALPAARLDLADLPRIVPPHASVLMLDPLTPLPIDGITLTQNTALFSDAAYFLVDRNAITTTDPYFVLRVEYLGVDPALPSRPTPEQEAGFDFILTTADSPEPPPDPAAFPLRWISREAGLALYQRRP